MSSSESQPPIAVGGSGGSGTRVPISILALGGRFVGADVNRATDSLLFLRVMVYPYEERVVARFFAGENPPVETDIRRAYRRFEAEFTEPVTGTDTPWAWKHPRTIYFLPLLRRLRPDLRFVHIVRDGRDMAWSKNQRQVNDLLAAAFAEDMAAVPAPVQSVALWARANTIAADFGEQVMGPDYLRVRYEDLCRDPLPWIERILAFGGHRPVAAVNALWLISPIDTIGRHRRQEPAMLERVEETGGDALERFGYR